jgi:hypothetical protein
MVDWIPSTQAEKKENHQTWTLFTDGAWGQVGTGASVGSFNCPIWLKVKIRSKIIIQSNKQRSRVPGTHPWTQQGEGIRSKTLLIKIDSHIVAGQDEKEYLAHNQELAKYLPVVRGLERRFKGFTLRHIPRSEKNEVNELAKAAANNLPIPPETFYQVLKSRATELVPKAFHTVLLAKGED